MRIYVSAHYDGDGYMEPSVSLSMPDGRWKRQEVDNTPSVGSDLIPVEQWVDNRARGWEENNNVWVYDIPEPTP